MALALAKGFIAAKLIDPDQILVSAPSDRNLKVWRDDMNCVTTHDNSKVIQECDIIFLATKVIEIINAFNLFIHMYIYLISQKYHYLHTKCKYLLRLHDGIKKISPTAYYL